MPGECTLEVPVDEIADALAAAAFADRLELCSDLAAEGFTPSESLLAAVRRDFAGEVVALIRPQRSVRAAAATEAGEAPAFPADPRTLAEAVESIRRLADAGCDAVAFAAIDGRGRLDARACLELAEAARRARVAACLHRGFDLATDREEAWRIAADLGIARVLTSGAVGRWIDPRGAARRAEQLRADAITLAKVCGGGPQVVACGGIRAGNAAAFLSATSHLHASCRGEGRFDADAAASLRQVLDGGGW